MIKVKHNEWTYTVPCGKCAFCLSNKRSQWMFRIFQEIKNQDQPGWFITLTYDEKHVKRTAHGLSLRFRDVQLFIKKIRKAKYYIKYLCVGEYGGQTKRPHYHMLVWTNCPVETMDKTWHHGSIHFGRITMESAMYTLKYIINPKTKKTDGLEPTRAQFSKGLGLSYLSRAVYDYHTFDYERPNLLCRIDGRQVALPRYYRLKIFTKYQLGIEREKTKAKKCREQVETWRNSLKVLGTDRRQWKKYHQEIREEQARRILQNTKLNTTL